MSDRFYMIEDKYIPPAPPKMPEESENEENAEAMEIYEEEKKKYEQQIEQEEADFSPDFEVPRVGCPMLATLAETLAVKQRVHNCNKNQIHLEIWARSVIIRNYSGGCHSQTFGLLKAVKPKFLGFK